MGGSSDSPAVRDGLTALAAGQWVEARALLTAAVAELAPGTADLPRAAAGLSEALWWLGEVDQALAAREQAYKAWRVLGDESSAAAEALWLSREYLGAVGNDAAARGWLERAVTLAGDQTSQGLTGWILLTRAWLTDDPQEQLLLGGNALAAARDVEDGDLEVLTLGRVALGLVSLGREEEGLARFDEAMASATSGEASLATLASLCCDLVLASERSGELERFSQWNEVVGRIATQHGHPPLVSFCATCCAEAFAAAGNWSGAERELRGALETLRRGGHRSRCVAAEAKLAELLVLQGRLEEAEQLIGDDDTDATLVVRARLALAHGDAQIAATLAERHCRRHHGDSLATAPSLALLVEACLAAGDLDAATVAVERLDAVATRTTNRRAAGRAALARGRLAITSGRPIEAIAALEDALDRLSTAAPGALETAESHLALARLRLEDAPELARGEARAALTGFEGAGATRYVDETTALLRSLGDRSRVGAKGNEMLTDREHEVLRLVTQGLTNAEIADRLFISVKTAGNHVSNILAKLHLRSRSEAAAWAVVHAEANARR